jgi:hypothetical protein
MSLWMGTAENDELKNNWAWVHRQVSLLLFVPSWPSAYWVVLPSFSMGLPHSVHRPIAYLLWKHLTDTLKVRFANFLGVTSIQ